MLLLLCPHHEKRKMPSHKKKPSLSPPPAGSSQQATQDVLDALQSAAVLVPLAPSQLLPPADEAMPMQSLGGRDCSGNLNEKGTGEGEGKNKQSGRKRVGFAVSGKRLREETTDEDDGDGDGDHPRVQLIAPDDEVIIEDVETAMRPAADTRRLRSGDAPPTPPRSPPSSVAIEEEPAASQQQQEKKNGGGVEQPPSPLDVEEYRRSLEELPACAVADFAALAEKGVGPSAAVRAFASVAIAFSRETVEEFAASFDRAKAIAA